MSDSLAHLAPYLASALAVLLSLLNLYLGRRDRMPRLRIRLRYEYRAAGAAAVHDRSQEGLYMRLGEFLREHDLAYPSGTPVVRFAVSNVGEKAVHLKSVRLVLRAKPFGEALVLDPKHVRLRRLDLSTDAPVNLLSGRSEVRSGGSIGYRFELIRLSEILTSEGFDGNIRLALEVTDRLNRIHRCYFDVNTDLWTSSESNSFPP